MTAGVQDVLRAYQARMNTLMTDSLFDHRMSYRRLEVQARLRARIVEAEVANIRFSLRDNASGGVARKRRRVLACAKLLIYKAYWEPA